MVHFYIEASLLKYRPFNPSYIIFPFYKKIYEILTTCQLCKVPNKNFCIVDGMTSHMYILNILNQARLHPDVYDERNHEIMRGYEQ